MIVTFCMPCSARIVTQLSHMVFVQEHKKQPRMVPAKSTTDQTLTTFHLTAMAADSTAAHTTPPGSSTFSILATSAALSKPAPAPPAPVPQAPAEQAPVDSASAYVDAPLLEATMRPTAHLAALEPAPAEQAPTQGAAAHMAALRQGFITTNFAAAPEPAVTKGPRADGAVASLAAHELVNVGTKNPSRCHSADKNLAGPAAVVDTTAYEADCGPVPREGAKTPEGGVTDHLAPTEGVTTFDGGLADQSQAEQAPIIDDSGCEADCEQAPRVKTYCKGFEGVAPASGVFGAIEQVQLTGTPFSKHACVFCL